ncbi:BolA family transcriptional regulator [Buchnera aphidicola (Sitobion miscanthi)]|uniref:BolA family protein n=1 Tax=Buchnera aphidicola TaxID=9 RepID=UPI0020B7E588|nr:BolA family protein [Buchnera aphidicola]MCU4136847.1 BolA family transcriptional regulator [Buchnera aphidicola (Sitobion miscanthi)]
MDNQNIKSLLVNRLNLEKAFVTGDKNHIKIIAIGNIFKGITQVKKQQIVYKPLINMISEKQIHAVSIVTYTPQEWEKYTKENNSDYL